MAERSFDGNLAKTVTLQDLQGAGVQVTDPLKADVEFREIFKNVAHGDPTGAGAAVDGNFGQTHLCPAVTPQSANAEFAVEHGLGKTPVGWQLVVPARAGYKTVDVQNARDADATYLYLKSPKTGEPIVVRVW